MSPVLQYQRVPSRTAYTGVPPGAARSTPEWVAENPWINVKPTSGQCAIVAGSGCVVGSAGGTHAVALSAIPTSAAAQAMRGEGIGALARAGDRKRRA